MPAQITAILVTYNSAAVVCAALSSVAASPLVDKVIVVDNASTDDTCAVIESQYPDVLLLRNAENLGFGRANNRALEQVKTPFALLINPDATLAPDCMKMLLEAAGRYSDGALFAPMLSDGRGVALESYKRSVWSREKRRDRFYVPEGDVCADFLSGAIWLMRMDAFQTIGFFDPRFFLYYEDDDMCLRARQKGYGLIMVHRAHATHLTGASTPSSKALNHFKQFQQTLSRLLFEEKYNSRQSAESYARKWRNIYTARKLGAMLTLQIHRVTLYNSRLAAIRHYCASKNVPDMRA